MDSSRCCSILVLQHDHGPVDHGPAGAAKKSTAVPQHHAAASSHHCQPPPNTPSLTLGPTHHPIPQFQSTLV